jgi:transcriptional repressor NrdR
VSSIYDIGDSRVIESREGADGKTIRRRRETPDGKRFTTYERVEKPNLAVVKKDGTRELFDREKLSNAVTVSVGKFFTSEVEIEQIVDAVEEAVYGLGDNEVTSKQIGELVLEGLRTKNEVAYVRFASVYYEFKTLDEFREILGQAVKSKAA